jgi:alkaline phosphatase
MTAMKKVSISAITAAIVLAGCNGDDGTNGVNGANGSNGFNSLVSQTALAVGNEYCLNGGVQIDSGLDSNSNSLLDQSEIQATEYVCTPTLTSVSADKIAATVNNPWFTKAEANMAELERQMQAQVTARGGAKNIILFVGDGMGISTVTAARIKEGQKLGKLGEEHQLSFEKMPYSGFAKTYNVDSQTPDSAGTMTALVTGVKTDIGVLGINENATRGDCSSVAGNELVSALELAEIAGMSTGIISTARITHATPAATYAKSADRNWEDNSDMPIEATNQGCQDIAAQLVNFEANLEQRFNVDVDGIEVVLGGGRRHFLPKDVSFNTPDAVSAVEGDRTDGVDLTASWQTKYPQGSYVIDQKGFDQINPANTNKLFGLFNESHMQYEDDRANDFAGEPSLSEMTEKAIDILDNNSKGFFLTVEAGRIDHGHHDGNAHRALGDAVEFAKAIDVAMKNTDPKDTLIIVTADHSHVFTIAGYPKRGNPILGKVVGIGKSEPSLALDGKPYTTLAYTNGPGAAGTYDNATGERVDLTNLDTTALDFKQQALVPMSSETHAGEDVGVYAQGPGAHLVTGTNEQNYLFHVMDYAANLVTKVQQKQAQ